MSPSIDAPPAPARPARPHRAHAPSPPPPPVRIRHTNQVINADMTQTQYPACTPPQSSSRSPIPRSSRHAWSWTRCVRSHPRSCRRRNSARRWRGMRVVRLGVRFRGRRRMGGRPRAGHIHIRRNRKRTGRSLGGECNLYLEAVVSTGIPRGETLL
jgi:hypothetical protein